MADNIGSKNSGFYKKLRSRMRTWLKSKAGRGHRFAEMLMLAPDLFHLLCRLSCDPEVPPAQKARLLAAIAYFISPVDLIHEALVGPAGYVDDVALAAYVLNGVINRCGHGVVERHWAGDGDVLAVVKRVLELADKALSAGIWNKLKGVVRG